MTASLCLVVWQSLVPHTPERQRNTLAFLPEPAMKSPHCVLLGRGRQAEGWSVLLGLGLCKTLCFFKHISPKLWQGSGDPEERSPKVTLSCSKIRTMNFQIMEAALWAALKEQPGLSPTSMARPPGLSQAGSGTTQGRRAVFARLWAQTRTREVTWSCSLAEAGKGQGFWCSYLILLLLPTLSASTADCSRSFPVKDKHQNDLGWNGQHE